MNVLGYLVTLANIQSFAGPGGSVKDIAVRVSEVSRLLDELRTQPEFVLEGFRATGFYRVGNVGKYLSKNLRDYMYYGTVDPHMEGVVVTLRFSDAAGYDEDSAGEDGAFTYYIPRTPVTDDVREGIREYMERAKRNALADTVAR